MSSIFKKQSKEQSTNIKAPMIEKKKSRGRRIRIFSKYKTINKKPDTNTMDQTIEKPFEVSDLETVSEYYKTTIFH